MSTMAISLEFQSFWDITIHCCRQEHVTKVQLSQQKKERLQAHYLSADSHNEFIALCADYVRKCILEELNQAKYYSIMVDATPNASHTEQTTFVLRYLLEETGEFMIKERFLTFVDSRHAVVIP